MNEMYLEHHGILGQKWGVRRYQNEDGSLTSAGEKRYYKESNETKKLTKKYNRELYDINSHSGQKRTAIEAQHIKTEEQLNASKKKDQVKNEFAEDKMNIRQRRSTGQKVANLVINGPIGAGVFNNMRASGYSPLISEGTVIVSTMLGGPIGQTAAYILTNNGNVKKI